MTIEGALEAVETTEWPKGGHWKISTERLAATPHYHSVTHEAYTVLHGSGSYLLGKSPLDPEADSDGNMVGVKFTAHAGDVFVFPAGVTHFVTDTEGGYEILGFYLLNDQNSIDEPYDMEYALDSPEDTEKKRRKCELVPVPVHDPIYGKEGPMQEIWAAR
ncbi:uncharacterized protein N7482_004532 [Penicillium canariense]|uniref:Cupin type-1 domain-containing protein n=1 Tax=Penicillium canariense TaxID=189055 RepID=A0A9W9LQL5_9EURO|nr:uncharacterized protein N7482_004532 [Penicillium canariense]KAJ5168938.1 hypothetical protein N7482_004532 [Penicillium canariense]